jgi:hypothetical protein
MVEWSRREVLALVASGAVVLGDARGSGASMVTSLASIHLLRSARGGTDRQVEGYYFPRDGGGGTFVWDADCVEPDDGFATIAVDGELTGRWRKKFPINSVSAIEAGIRTSNSPERNTRQMLAIRDYIIKVAGAWTVYLPSGLLRLTTGRWLQGIQRVRVVGNNTQVQNVRRLEETRGLSTTECIPLIVNHDLMLDFGGGKLDGFGVWNIGSRIHSCRAGEASIQLMSPFDYESFVPGTPVIVHGFNETISGYPPSLRYFSFNVVKSVDRTSGIIYLDSPLTADFNENWFDHVDGSYPPIGAARVLSLRRTGFSVAEDIVVEDIEFLPSPYFVPGEVPDSLRGSVYTSGCLNIVLKNVKINGYFYPTSSDNITVIDSYVWFSEFDKIVSKLGFHNCVLREVGNGPGVNNIIIRDCVIQTGIKILNARNVLIEGSTFEEKGLRLNQFIAVAAACPSNLHLKSPHVDQNVLAEIPLVNGGTVLRGEALILSDTEIAVSFKEGVNDFIRGVTLGSIIRFVGEDGEFHVEDILRKEEKAVFQGRFVGKKVGGTSKKSVFINILRSLFVTDAALADFEFNPKAEAPFDIVGLVEADYVSISCETRYVSRDESHMELRFFDWREAFQVPEIVLGVYDRVRSLVIDVDDLKGGGAASILKLSLHNREGKKIVAHEISASKGGKTVLIAPGKGIDYVKFIRLSMRGGLSAGILGRINIEF